MHPVDIATVLTNMLSIFLMSTCIGEMPMPAVNYFSLSTKRAGQTKFFSNLSICTADRKINLQSTQNADNC